MAKEVSKQTDRFIQTGLAGEKTTQSNNRIFCFSGSFYILTHFLKHTIKQWIYGVWALAFVFVLINQLISCYRFQLTH